MSKKQVRVAIAGASGRMGIELVKALQGHNNVLLGAALEQIDSPLLGRDVGELAGIGKLGVVVQSDLQSMLSAFDILIDFTRPLGTLSYLPICRQHKKSIVIGTTGFDEKEKEVIRQASEEIAVVLSANYSIGVNVVLNLLETAAKIMGEDADIEIIEAHHKYKVDAPSGTALAMGEVIANTLGLSLQKEAVYSRQGHTGERKARSIGFSTIRAGDIVGEHTVMFVECGERVEIAHKASSRRPFASGAIRAAGWVANKPAGLYTMRDVLSLEAF